MPRYIAFNKPYNVLSQFTPAPGSRSLTLAGFGFPDDVYPVGRLDADSEGLLLLSDDASLTTRLHDARRPHPRTYLVQIERIPTPETLAMLERGVVIQGRRTLPCRAGLLSESPELPPRPVPIRERRNVPDCWIRLQLREGRNRQVRRMTAHVGHPTLRLWRESIGELSLSRLGIDPGEWTYLNSEQLKLALKL